jgi:hypothetical protein
MSAHSSAPHALHKRDLQACIDVPSVFTLFHQLRYPVEKRPIHVPLDSGELPAQRWGILWTFRGKISSFSIVCTRRKWHRYEL